MHCSNLSYSSFQWMKPLYQWTTLLYLLDITCLLWGGGAQKIPWSDIWGPSLWFRLIPPGVILCRSMNISEPRQVWEVGLWSPGPFPVFAMKMPFWTHRQGFLEPLGHAPQDFRWSKRAWLEVTSALPGREFFSLCPESSSTSSEVNSAVWCSMGLSWW